MALLKFLKIYYLFNQMAYYIIQPTLAIGHLWSAVFATLGLNLLMLFLTYYIGHIMAGSLLGRRS